MRYFQIAEPLHGTFSLTLTQDAAPAEPVDKRDTETVEGQPTCIGVELVKPQSAVTSAAFITPGVRNSAGKLPTPQPIAANTLFKGPTDYF